MENFANEFIALINMDMMDGVLEATKVYSICGSETTN